MNIEKVPDYSDLVSQFKEAVRCRIEPGAIVAVVSRGDSALLELGSITGWHFPRRADGFYAGYYPADSSAAIAHVEELRTRGAKYIAFPQSAFWWLEHYPDFHAHLKMVHRLIQAENSVCIIFALDATAAPDRLRQGSTGPGSTSDSGTTLLSALNARQKEEVKELFDLDFYSQQAGPFDSVDSAIGHFFEQGHAQGYNPNPYFDSEYYCSQNAGLRSPATNPLAHYVINARQNRAHRPNPLFDDTFYLHSNPDVQSQGNIPFIHYLQRGVFEGRAGSGLHENIAAKLLASLDGQLTRGNWTVGTILLFIEGGDNSDTLRYIEIAKMLGTMYHLACRVVLLRHPALAPGDQLPGNAIVLEDFELARPVLRQSALRLLVKSLSTRKPIVALATSSSIEDILEAENISTVLISGALADAHRSRARNRIAPQARIRKAATALAKCIRREFPSPEIRNVFRRERRSLRPRRVIVPCCDWSLSGVNSALECLGKQLAELGWKVEILFTRDLNTTHADSASRHTPDLRHHHLRGAEFGVVGGWSALISYLEGHAPCILLTSYDFVANSVIPALESKVGVVMWVQSDDVDYYEQAYRLGRYCNALVCVSKHIRNRIRELNPKLVAAAKVIHNSSVWRKDIAPRETRRSQIMRLVYTGRLVQYQKRILDIIQLAIALDRTKVAYQITLIGEFSPSEDTQRLFVQRAQRHLADGRLKLLGRLKQRQILNELSQNDFFILMSDFEGLPLSVVEAMARGCIPVVASMNSGIPEIVVDGRNGFIMPDRDYDNWARRLTKCWSKEAQFTALSTNACRSVQKGLTVEKMTRQFDELLCNVWDGIETGSYLRPASLNWNPAKMALGDVLPPPSCYRC